MARHGPQQCLRPGRDAPCTLAAVQSVRRLLQNRKAIPTLFLYSSPCPLTDVQLESVSLFSQFIRRYVQPKKRAKQKESTAEAKLIFQLSLSPLRLSYPVPGAVSAYFLVVLSL